VEVDEVPMHLRCFRCDHPGCAIKLSVSHFESHNHKFYCPKHIEEARRSDPAVFTSHLYASLFAGLLTVLATKLRQ
jgi:hypothetical protein